MGARIEKIAMTSRILSFLAITLTALAFVPAAAHLMEMSRKLDLAQHDYFVVQSIYGGGSYSGWIIFGALAANLFFSRGTAGGSAVILVFRSWPRF
jgi:hypothetical protein